MPILDLAAFRRRLRSPRDVHRGGHVGVISRSTASATDVAHQLAPFGLGVSRVVGLADALRNGMAHPELLAMFDGDAATDAVVLIGPFDDHEEACIAWIAVRMRKPLVGFLGDFTPAQSARLAAQGVHVTPDPGMLGELTASVVEPRWLPFD